MRWWRQGMRIAPRCASVVLVLLTACGGGGGGSVPDPGPGPDDGPGVGGGGGGGVAGTEDINPPSGPPKAYVLDSLVVPAAESAAATRGVALSTAAVRPQAVSLALPQWSNAPLPLMPVPGLPM